MEPRFRVRLDELRADAQIPLGLTRGLLGRLEAFLRPFADTLRHTAQRSNARHYVQGLLSDLPSKDAESIAYLHDRERQGLQKFIGQADWDHRPLFAELAGQVGCELGQPDGVLVFDPSAFPKKGTESVGVARQWCGRLGKVDNCQVGVYLAYVSRSGHALVDVRLYLPKQWTRGRKRRTKAGVPKEVRFRTRHELALDMLDQRGPLLPHAWISGDDEMGRCTWFRQELRRRGESYLLAVPGNTLVRDLVADPPPYAGHGRRPQAPFQRVGHWAARLPESAWQTIEVRDGEKGPLVVQGAWTAVEARTEGRASDVAETLVVFRERQGDGTWKYDYLLSDVIRARPLVEFARVFKRNTGSKSVCSAPRGKRVWQTIKCGRGWDGIITKLWRWWRPGSCSRKPGGGKIQTPALTGRQLQVLLAGVLARLLGVARNRSGNDARRIVVYAATRKRFYHWKQRNRLPPRRFEQRT